MRSLPSDTPGKDELMKLKASGAMLQVVNVSDAAVVTSAVKQDTLLQLQEVSAMPCMVVCRCGVVNSVTHACQQVGVRAMALLNGGQCVQAA